MNERATPILTVDSALPPSVCYVDPKAIADLYDQIPVAGKPGIDTCIIHVSAAGFAVARAAPISGSEVAQLYPRLENSPRQTRFLAQYRPVYGATTFEPNQAKQLNEQVPSADIVLFLGSALYARNTFAAKEALRRSLTRFALQGSTALAPIAHARNELATELVEAEAAERGRNRRSQAWRLTQLTGNLVLMGGGGHSMTVPDIAGTFENVGEIGTAETDYKKARRKHFQQVGDMRFELLGSEQDWRRQVAQALSRNAHDDPLALPFGSEHATITIRSSAALTETTFYIGDSLLPVRKTGPLVAADETGNYLRTYNARTKL